MAVGVRLWGWGFRVLPSMEREIAGKPKENQTSSDLDVDAWDLLVSAQRFRVGACCGGF